MLEGKSGPLLKRRLANHVVQLRCSYILTSQQKITKILREIKAQTSKSLLSPRGNHNQNKKVFRIRNENTPPQNLRDDARWYSARNLGSQLLVSENKYKKKKGQQQ